MISQEIKKMLKKLPDSPGVYFFLDKNKRILYIGKATSLKDRVRSYFNKDIINTRSSLIYKMLTQFETIDYTKTDSVLEALVLEAHLIKKHQPEANIKEKDNKSFNFVVITKEDFPRVLIIRGRDLLHHKLNSPRQRLGEVEIGYSFGPFPNGTQLKEALKIVRKMFPFRDKCLPCIALATQGDSVQATASHKATQCKACFNRQIGLCPGVCSGEISKESYAKQIHNIKLFFEGNKKQLLKSLQTQMRNFAKEKKFEKANITKRTLFSLNHIQDVSLIKEDLFNIRGGASTVDTDVTIRIESYDIAHMSGQNVVGVMTVVEDGEIKKSDYRKFSAKGGSAFGGKTVLGNSGVVNDTKALSEVLNRRLGHIEWRFPELVVVDGGTAQKRAMEKILKENNLDIPVVSVVKDERHRPKEILGDKKWLKYEKDILLSNAEAHRFAISFHKGLRNKLFTK